MILYVRNRSSDVRLQFKVISNHLHIAGPGFTSGRDDAPRGSPMGACKFIPLVSRRTTEKSRGDV